MSSLTPADFCVPTPAPPPVDGPGAAPEKIVGGRPSSICSTGWQPILITGLLRDLLIRHFRTPLNVETPDLRSYVWSPGDRTGILVESIHRWRGDLVEKRPALIIKRNTYKNVRIGVADFQAIDRHGFYEFATFWSGSHTVFCINTTGAASEILATEVQRELTQFGPLMVQYLGMMKWMVTEVGAVVEIEEAKEGFAVPITVGWAYQENWRLEAESLLLRRIPLSMLVAG
jgi:hypothetical protein